MSKLAVIFLSAFTFVNLFNTNSFGQATPEVVIPKATLDFFKGTAKPDAEFASMVFVGHRYFYNVDQQNADGSVRLAVRLKVVPDSTGSYFDKSRVAEPYVAYLLNHEQGHINIGYIIGNMLRSALNLTVYSSNYKEEIKANFNKFYAKFDKLQQQYDEETNHSQNKTAQALWDEKIRLLLIETSKADFKQEL